MTSSVTSTPISIPTGIRATSGQITIDTTYAGGTQLTAAQFGGGSNGVPNRLPDFVIFTGKAMTDFTAVVPIAYDSTTGKIHVYGTALTDDTGITEEASETISADVFGYLALWVSPDPAGVTTTVA